MGLEEGPLAGVVELTGVVPNPGGKLLGVGNRKSNGRAVAPAGGLYMYAPMSNGCVRTMPSTSVKAGVSLVPAPVNYVSV